VTAAKSAHKMFH